MTNEEREAIFEELRGVLSQTEFGRSEAVGRLILQRCFGGDIAAWKDRQPGKNRSFRKIAEHPDCPMSKTSLCRDVGVYVALRTLPAEVTRGLTATHIAEVLKLDHDERVRFLREASAQRWSTNKLRQTIVDFRRCNGERRGRPPSPLARKSVQLLKKSVELAEQGRGALNQSRNVDADVKDEIEELLDCLSAASTDIRERLKQRRPRQDSHMRLAKAECDLPDEDGSNEREVG